MTGPAWLFILPIAVSYTHLDVYKRQENRDYRNRERKRRGYFARGNRVVERNGDWDGDRCVGTVPAGVAPSGFARVAFFLYRYEISGGECREANGIDSLHGAGRRGDGRGGLHLSLIHI